MVFLQALLNELLAALADVLEGRVVEMVLALHDVVDDLWLSSSRERHLARKHDVEDYAHGPNVDFEVVSLEEYLRGDVVGGAAHGVHGLIALHLLGQPEVNHLDAVEVVLEVEHEVLRFDVSVRYLLRVQVLQRLEKLPHDERSDVLCEVLLINDELEELSTLAILQHEEAYFIPLPDLVQLDDVGVIKRLQDLHFIHKCLQVLHALLLDGLDRELLLCLPLNCKVHNAEAARGQLGLEMVLLFDLALVGILEEKLDVHRGLVTS